MIKDDVTPLYAQIRMALVARIAGGEFPGGACLPSETALAAEQGVSQGTVRKAIDSLVAEGVLIRRQGKGTYVAEQTVARAQYRFFRMVDSEGSRVTPVTRRCAIRTIDVHPAVAKKLQLRSGDPGYQIEREREVDGRTALLETIVVPLALMPGLDRHTLPNALYPFYQEQFGHSVITTDDQMSATIANAQDAQALGRAEGTALLVIDRVARDLTGRPLEWRRTRCLCEDHAWAVTLR